MKTEKKKTQKPSEKFRTVFTFDWSVQDDTAKGETNPLYQKRVEPQLLFGRGYRAGIDVRVQRKQNDFYDNLAKRRAENEGDARGLEDLVRQRERALVSIDGKNVIDMMEGHWTTKKLEEMSERDWRIFREDFSIYIKGGKVPAPMRTWAEGPLPWELLEAVRATGYERPTPIQMQAIPIGCECRDLIGVAETGSGKTAAFVLPLLSYVKGLPVLNDETCQDGPYCLVLAPTRELAEQIHEETKKFSFFCAKVRVVCVIGGTSGEAQAFQLRRGAEVVIATPGRLKDCLERAYTVLSQCNYIVLDEADRMVALGFEECLQEILDAIPSTNMKSALEDVALEQELQAKAGHRRYRITQMFSATMPPAVEKLARKYLRAPAFISVGDPGAGKRSIEQRLEFISEGKKKQRLEEVLREHDPPVMVFVNQKKVSDLLVRHLCREHFSAVALHGGKGQEVRSQALEGFKNGSYDILVATDVAGRGIDVQDVQLVVNFDMPDNIESYTHRIGRTGRAGKKGLSISFVTEDNSAIYYDLKVLLENTKNIVPHELATHPASKQRATPGGPVAQKKGPVYAV
eukprot:GHVR01082481.1.p1 GENE.GHVR01082481.1~~GHVR01082481.1.p1  ORF type:complete len:573 (+),score=141.76 GHVR01082481.1:490-2208(+)